MVIYDYRIDEFACHELLEGAVRFELWHGVNAVKKVGQIRTDSPEPYVITSAFHYKYIHDHIFGDYVLAPSRSLSNVMSAAFHVPLKNIIISDQPRCHTLYMTKMELDDFVVKYEDAIGVRMYKELKAESRQKVIYMPTFRDANPKYIYKAIPDWDEFNSFLKTNNIVLYLKVHRVTPLPTGLGYSNIQILDNSLDIYPLLPLFDRLITDYSSIMFDFALMHKPVIIYDFDIEEYATKSRYVFKGFIELLKSLSEAKNYQELTSLMLTSDASIKPFPTSRYYDCPGDISSIINFITTRL
jgi:CDP-glycerol glycerophosphotransferase